MSLNGALDDCWTASHGSTTQAAFLTTGGWPIGDGTWDTTGFGSAWISWQSTYGPTSTDPAGLFAFETTFSINGSPRLGSLAMNLWVDNVLVDILVNGVSAGLNSVAGNPGDPYQTWVFASFAEGHTYVLPARLFRSGANTLTFLLWNYAGPDPNPVGMRAEFADTFEDSPESSQLALFGIGLAAIGALRLRTRRRTR